MANEHNFLFEFVADNLYQANAFRISGLPVNATTKDIRRQIQRLTMLRKYETSDTRLQVPLALDFFPDDDTIREAIQRVGDPERRIVDELFWFWPADSTRDGRDEALQALVNNDIEAARNIWRQRMASQKDDHVSLHNLAVLTHLIALELEHKGVNTPLKAGEIRLRNQCWADAFRLWRDIISQNGFWIRFARRLQQLEDPRLTTKTASDFRRTLPVALLSINARLALKALETENRKEAVRHLKYMQGSGFDETVVNKALCKAVLPVRDRIMTICRAASDSNETPATKDRMAEDLLNSCLPLLTILDTLLPERHSIQEAAHNEVALAALHIIIAFANETEQWVRAREVTEKIDRAVCSTAVQNRVEDNLRTLEENIKNRVVNRTCYFCMSNPAVKKAIIKVKMYGNVQESFYRITWNHAEIEVPRCSRCKKAHDRIDNARIGGGLIGALAGLGGCVAISASSGAWFGGLIAMVLFIFVGIGIGSLIGKRGAPPGMKPESDKTNYYRIKMLLSEGWNFGDKPPQAN